MSTHLWCTLSIPEYLTSGFWKPSGRLSDSFRGCISGKTMIHCIFCFAEMDENEAMDEEMLAEGDIIRVIPLDDHPEMDDGISESEDEGMAVSSGIEEQFENTITEADRLIMACSDEAFIVRCFEDRWIVVGGKDDRAILYNSQSLEAVLRIDDHKDSVICAEFCMKGNLLATGDMSGLIVISSTANLRKCYLIDDCEELSWIQWHSSVDILFAGGKNGIWMWLITLDSVQQTKVYLCDSPTACIDGKLLNDGKRLLSCYEDGSVRLWSLKDEKSISIDIGAANTTCLDVHHSLSVAIVGDYMAHCYLVSTETAKILRIFTVVEEAEDLEITIECVKFCPGTEPWFIVGTNSGRLAIYDFNSGTLRHILKDSADPVVICRWYVTDSNEMYAIGATYSGIVGLWNSRGGEPFLALLSKSVAEQDSHLLSMDLSMKGPILCATYNSGQLCKFYLVNR